MSTLSKRLSQAAFSLAAASCILDALLGLFFASAYLRNPAISLGMKAALTLCNFAAWSWIWICVLLLIQAGRAIVEHSSIPLPSLAQHALRLTLGGLGVAFYLANWFLFKYAGAFIGGTAIAFLRSNLREVLFDIVKAQPRELLTLCIATVSVTVLGGWLFRRLQRNSEFRFRNVETGGALILAMLGTGLLFLRPGRSEVFRVAVHSQTGPAAAWLREIIEAAMPLDVLRASPAEVRSYLTSPSKKIIPLSDYLTSQPRSGLKSYNVIFILVESLRANRLKSLGAVRDVMPHLDQLARTSLVFTQAYSESSQTDMAEGTGLSSQYSMRGNTHLSDAALDFPRVMLHDILKARGYRTGIFSSQNERWGGQLRFLDTGSLDIVVDAENNPAESYLDERDAGVAEAVRTGLLRRGYVGDRATLESARRWIETGKGRPFFLYMNLQHSHFPYSLPTGVSPVFSPHEIDFPVSFAGYPRDKKQIMENRYDNSLHAIDALLGDFFAQLQSLGLWDQTIVVLSGDHGEAFFEHGHVTHASNVFNEVLHIPLIVRAPGLAPGLRSIPAQHVDIPPMVLDLLGMTPHPAFQGVDLLSPDAPENRPLYSVVNTGFGQSCAILQAGYKLSYDFNTHVQFLSDLRNDPAETHNLFLEKPQAAGQLQQALRFWINCQTTYYGDREIFRQYYPPSYR